MNGISVVIPTYNRGALLAATLELCEKRKGGVDLELIVIDDGSRDDTAARLAALSQSMPNLRWKSIPNGGPGQARNIGAAMATHPIILFLGDDIQAQDDGFFRAHLDLHQRFPEPDVAVLGKVSWSNRPDDTVTFVMSHVQGLGGEQFGYAHLNPYSWLDWRFFYTANVSMKRARVSDWAAEGFQKAFTLAAYEDIEFAYRMSRSPGGFRIFYSPVPAGVHFHDYTVDGFMGRQLSAGMMGRVFAELHPGIEKDIGLSEVATALRRPGPAAAAGVLADYVSVIEGIKSYGRLFDTQFPLGTSHWHGEFLKAVFVLCYQQGYVMASRTADENFAEAYRLCLEQFGNQLRRVVQVEFTGTALPNDLFQRPLERPAMPPIPPPMGRAAGPLRSWARRQPWLVTLYRRAKGLH